MYLAAPQSVPMFGPFADGEAQGGGPAASTGAQQGPPPPPGSVLYNMAKQVADAEKAKSKALPLAIGGISLAGIITAIVLARR
jgi:hypothetical protein